MPRTIEQLRAEHALNGVRNVQSGTLFTSVANSLPTMIHTNGLGQAIAFFKGKSDQQYEEIIQMLSDWLCKEGKPFANNNPSDILSTITQVDMHTYILAQTEAVAYLLWVKKFAKAILGEGEEE